MRRLVLPVVFVVVLVGIVALSARLGYVGRVDGGPLGTPGGYGSFPNRGKPRWYTVDVGGLGLDGDAVRVTGAGPTAVSPGLVVRGPRRTALEGPPPRSWPPGSRFDRGRLVGTRFDGEGGLVLAMRARRPGVYVLDDYALDYSRGARRYRRRLGTSFCVAVRQRCAEGLRLPKGGRVADLGGPSDYGVRLRGADLGESRLDAHYPARTGEHRLTITLTNRTDEQRVVTRIRWGQSSGDVVTRLTGPDRVVLAPHASRSVPLTLTVRGCAKTDMPGGSFGFGDLDAHVDGDAETIPLLVGITLDEVTRC